MPGEGYIASPPAATCDTFFPDTTAATGSGRQKLSLVKVQELTR
jgi:hypothetical protein